MYTGFPTSRATGRYTPLLCAELDPVAPLTCTAAACHTREVRGGRGPGTLTALYTAPGGPLRLLQGRHRMLSNNICSEPLVSPVHTHTHTCTPPVINVFQYHLYLLSLSAGKPLVCPVHTHTHTHTHTHRVGAPRAHTQIYPLTHTKHTYITQTHDRGRLWRWAAGLGGGFIGCGAGSGGSAGRETEMKKWY